MTTPQQTFSEQTNLPSKWENQIRLTTAHSIYCADCLCGRHFETSSGEWVCPDCHRHIVLDWGMLAASRPCRISAPARMQRHRSLRMPIPSELLEYKQWILWRRTEVNGRIAKLPISPWSGKLAACDKPQTWSTYRHVCYAGRKFRSDGIGFVFTSSDPFCGIDLDQCRTRTVISRRKRRRLSTDWQATRSYRLRVPVSTFW